MSHAAGLWAARPMRVDGHRAAGGTYTEDEMTIRTRLRLLAFAYRMARISGDGPFSALIKALQPAPF